MRDSRLGTKAIAMICASEDYPHPLQKLAQEENLNLPRLQNNRQPWEILTNEVRRLYIAAYCEKRRQVRAAIRAEHPELNCAPTVDAKIGDYVGLVQSANEWASILHEEEFIVLLTAADKSNFATHAPEAKEITRGRSEIFANLPTKKRLLAQACYSLGGLEFYLRRAVVTIPGWSAFIAVLKDYEDVTMFLGNIDGIRLARREQGASGGKGKAIRLEARINNAVKEFEIELVRTPQISASRLAETLVGVPAINLGYKKLYEIARECVYRQKAKGAAT